MKVLSIALMVLLLTGCTSVHLRTPESERYAETVETSEIDFINIGDKQYVNAWELALVDTTEMEAIGEVERGSIIPEGTPVYEISGYPEQEVVAIKHDGSASGLVTNISGYLVYVLHGEGSTSHYPNIQDQQVKQSDMLPPL
jgi:hypothetical protein